MNPRSPGLTLVQALKIFSTWRTPRFMLILSVCLLAVRATLGPVGLADLFVLLGVVVVYPFFEWLFHKYILHAKPFTIFGCKFHAKFARTHTHHHQNPHDYTLWAMPIASSMRTFAIVGVLAMLLMPMHLALSLLVLVPLFALVYEWTHFLCHTTYHPRTRLYRRLKRNHSLHHFKNENYWWGVLTSVADRVLGTMPKRTDVPTSPTCRSIL